MDPVTDAQYLVLKDSFARKGVNIEAALTPDGDIDYIYVVGRLLARAENVDQLLAAMPGLRRADGYEQPEIGGLVRLAIDQVAIDDSEAGSLSVPELLDLMDERLPNTPAGERPVTPVGIVHISKITPAGEPEVPSGYPTQPWPAPPPTGGYGKRSAFRTLGCSRTSDSIRG
jgi:hypothetical protein